MLCGTRVASLAAAPSISGDALVQRWIAASRADFDAAVTFGYWERIQDDDGDKTYEVTLLDGSPFKQLVRVNGQPLDAETAQKDRKKFADAEHERANESPDDRAHRIADYKKDFERGHEILEQMPLAFHYTLASTRKYGAYTVYVLQATPRKNYDPPSTEAEVLTGMRGEFLIDTKTFQLVRGIARVLHPVRIEGFVATVQPGTEFELEQRPAAKNVWLPTHFRIRSRSSVLFLFHHHTHEDRTFFNYRQESGATAFR